MSKMLYCIYASHPHVLEITHVVDENTASKCYISGDDLDELRDFLNENLPIEE